MSVIAYTMSAADGDAYFFEGAPDSVFCDNCGSCTDPTFLPTNLELKRTPYDVCSTYDGRMIVSARFRAFCRHHGFAGAQFDPVNDRGSLYLLRSNRTVAFDWERRETRFDRPCDRCGQYESVVGAYPAYLKGIEAPLLHGFYRTDLEFATGREKAPLLIVGTQTKALIEAEGFERAEFDGISR